MATQLFPRFSLDDIISATQNFNDVLVVGEGGFGKVYKATLTVQNGETASVAIKRLDSMSSQGANEFWAEIEMLTKWRHCNLVSLYGYCNDSSEMILIYEFMPQGSLHDHLKGNDTSMNWVQRLKISIGAARGLHHLHTGTSTQNRVIHRDIKSTNILLDEEYAAKIADFGLSKIGPANTSGAYVNTLVRGTFGYLDPEYTLTGRLTMKSDVYAFGVVLFELLCGRVALDNSLDEDKCSLVKWAPECIKKGKVHNIIDLKIKSQISEKCLKKFVAIAYRCLNSESQRRPNMTEILAALELCRELQNNSDRVKSAAGTSSIIRMFKWPFMSPEVTSENSGGEIDDLKLPDFKVYTYNQLRAATEWFSENNLLYKGGDKVPSAVYKGKLEDDGRLIVVKWCDRSCWPNTRKFLDEAKAVGRFRSKRLANLLGCCIEGDERYLVAEFMPHGSLSKHLFHRESQPLNWAMRLRVALYLAQSLDYCSSKGRFLYHDLTAKRVLFDQECNPRLSSFGLMKDKRDKKNNERDLNFRPPEYNTEGVTTEGVIYSFGAILFDLLSGRNIDPHFALGLIQAENFQMLIDSYLNGHISNDDRTELVRIASHCLQYSPEERPNAKSVVAALTNLQKQTDASSLALFGISNEPIPATNISKLSPLAHACERMDLFAIHAILEKIGYSGDAGLTFDFFDQMANDLIEGNKAFKASYFYEAIGWYTNLIEDGGAMLVSPTIYVRRCLCYLITYQKDKALGDAKQAQVIKHGWSTALYLQAVVLFTQGMKKEAHEVLKGAVLLDLET